MNFVLDHVGIAVHDLQQSAALYERAFGFHTNAAEELPQQGVKLALLTTGVDNGQASRLELLQATEPDSPVAKFLTTRGPGLHHLALRVDNLEGAMEHLRQQGFEVIGEPRRGADHCRVVFLHPRSAGGVLLELLQPE